MKVGNKIKKIRELRNYTQDYMATELEMTQAGYSKIELGETDVPFSRLLQIAKVLEIDLIDLLAFDEKIILNSTQNEFKDGAFGAVGINDIKTVSNDVLDRLEKSHLDRITSLEKEIERLHKLLEQALK